MASGTIRGEIMFILAIVALSALIGSLLWYTNWAEARVLGTDPNGSTREVR